MKNVDYSMTLASDANSVKVVIPVYKTDLDVYEQVSLRQCCKVLHRYPIVIIKPQSLCVDSIVKEYSGLQVENFDDRYFKSILGYNELMMSEELYSRFQDVKYILIHQLDAYVFRDELEQWIAKDYDYIGAPWILKPKQRRFYYRCFIRLKLLSYMLRRKPFAKHLLGDKVGNGGFSLRKVESHLYAARTKRELAQYFLHRSINHTEYNEDVFWATKQPTFRYPDVFEAIRFAVDVYPEICHNHNNQILPFGTHGWYGETRIGFWKNFIKV